MAVDRGRTSNSILFSDQAGDADDRKFRLAMTLGILPLLSICALLLLAGTTSDTSAGPPPLNFERLILLVAGLVGTFTSLCLLGVIWLVRRYPLVVLTDKVLLPHIGFVWNTNSGTWVNRHEVEKIEITEEPKRMKVTLVLSNGRTISFRYPITPSLKTALQEYPLRRSADRTVFGGR